MKPSFTFLFSLFLFGAKTFAQAPPANDDYATASTPQLDYSDGSTYSQKILIQR